MISKIRNKFKSEDNRRLLSNFMSLSVLQGASYILPLITLPYLVRVLGIEYFGLLAFATAIVTYFKIITDYGFNLSATREISIHREDKEKVVEIFSSVMIIKIILMFLSFIFLFILVFSFEKFSKDWEVYFLTFGTVIGQVLFPVWFFQGMERMKYITYLNILARAIFTVAVFIFVKEESDFYIVPLLASMGSFIAGTYSLMLIKKEFEISFVFQSMETIKYYLKDGWHIFTGSFGVSLYKNNVILILGIFTNDIIVGYFTIAKRIIDALNQIASIVSRTIFPYINKKYKMDQLFINFLIRLGIGIFLYTSVIFIILFYFAYDISNLIAGNIYYELVESIKIMAIVPLIIALNIPAVHILLLNKKDKFFAKSVLLGGIIDIILLVILIPIYGYIGASFTVLIVELFVTALLYYYAIKVIKGKL